VICLDLETAPFRNADILTNERILAIAIAKRESENSIDIKSWLLEEDSDEGEYKLLEKFNNDLTPEPLVVIGYGIRDYDIPLLAIKMKRYDPEITSVKERMPKVKKLWHIINLLERAVHIDLMTRFRFELKTSGFDELLDYKEFFSLPLKRIKHPPPQGKTLGEYMYELWKERPEEVRTLVESHVHDMLLITEYWSLKIRKSSSKYSV